MILLASSEKRKRVFKDQERHTKRQRRTHVEVTEQTEREKTDHEQQTPNDDERFWCSPKPSFQVAAVQTWACIGMMADADFLKVDLRYLLSKLRKWDEITLKAKEMMVIMFVSAYYGKSSSERGNVDHYVQSPG